MFSAVTHTVWTFIKHYILKRGFLDGWAGFVIAVGNSYGVFYRYAKFYEKEKALDQFGALENKGD